MKLSERLANRISQSITPSDLQSGWGLVKYLIAAWLYSKDES